MVDELHNKSVTGIGFFNRWALVIFLNFFVEPSAQIPGTDLLSNYIASSFNDAGNNLMHGLSSKTMHQLIKIDTIQEAMPFFIVLFLFFYLLSHIRVGIRGLGLFLQKLPRSMNNMRLRIANSKNRKVEVKYAKNNSSEYSEPTFSDTMRKLDNIILSLDKMLGIEKKEYTLYEREILGMR